MQKTITGCSKFGINDEETGKTLHLSRVCLDTFDWENDKNPTYLMRTVFL